MRLAACTALIFACSHSFCQITADITSNTEILNQITALQKESGDTHAKQVELLWQLAHRMLEGDNQVHRAGRPVAEAVRDADKLDYKAKFVYGLFRTREAFDTKEPFTRSRRIVDGTKHIREAMIMGARDKDFQFDAGLMLLTLHPEAEVYRTGVDALTLSRRMMGDTFAQLPKDRQGDWYAAVGMGLYLAGFQELARDNFGQAAQLAPDSNGGRRAVAWLRQHGA